MELKLGTMGTPAEHGLVLRARAGDAEALDRLTALLRLPLFAIAYAELRHYDDAQDVVVEALLRICGHLPHLQEPERIRPWMNRIVRNEARRLIAARAGQAARERGAESTPTSGGTEPASSILRMDIERALDGLPKNQARALALFYLTGLPIREIADRLGRPEGTIKFYLHQGRRELRLAMKGYEPMEQSATKTTIDVSARRENLWIASIISSVIAPEALAQMVSALKSVGWDEVRTIDDVAAVGRLEPIGVGDSAEFHLPSILSGSRCVVLDQRVAGRSAFELLPLLSATAERREMALFLLVDDAQDSPFHSMTAHAAYAAGVDMLLTKPFDLAVFARFGKHLRSSLARDPGIAA